MSVWRRSWADDSAPSSSGVSGEVDRRGRWTEDAGLGGSPEREKETEGERGGGGRERGRDWRERENDSITRQKESVVFRVLEERSAAGAKSQAHGLENLSPARNKLDFKKGARSGVSTHMWRQGRKAISINKCHFCHYVRLCQGCPDIQPACL